MLDTLITLIRIIFAIFLIFLLPGYTFIKMLFPRPREIEKENEWIAVLALSIGMSICVSIFDFFILATIPVPEGQKGWFDTPWIILSLLCWSALFGAIAYFRGAWPFLGRAPKEKKLEGIARDKHQARLNLILEEYDQLAKQRGDLLGRIRTVSRKGRSSQRSMREHYSRQKEKLVKELEDLDVKIKEFEELRWEELAEIEKIKLRKDGYIEVDEEGLPVENENGTSGKEENKDDRDGK